MNRFRDEVRIIPSVAWAIAFVVCIGLPLVAGGYLILTDHIHGGFLGFRTPELLIFAPILIFFSVYILLVGYIAADSRRRGMRPVLWVLLSLFVPNMIGIILYFILRSPLLLACPKCGVSSSASFAFCPSCGAMVSDACPSCRTAVEPGWAHCPKCGSGLRKA